MSVFVHEYGSLDNLVTFIKGALYATVSPEKIDDWWQRLICGLGTRDAINIPSEQHVEMLAKRAVEARGATRDFPT